MLIRQTILIMVFFVFGSSLALADTSPAGIPLNNDKPSADMEIHLEAVSEYEQEAMALEKKINKLVQRLKLYNEKPYLDSKELRRNGIKRTLGNLMKDHSELKQKMAWHQEKAKLIQQANKVEEKAPDQLEVVPD